MKKFLAGIVIFSVVVLGIVGALAVIPHTHGKDLNHSQHQSCPIYQFGISNVHADIVHVNVIVAIFLLCFLIETQKSLLILRSRLFAHLRAPPALI